MSFWKKLFGRSDQSVSQDYPHQIENLHEESEAIVDDQPIESEVEDELENDEKTSELVPAPELQASISTEDVSSDSEEMESKEAEDDLSPSIDAPEALNVDELEEKTRNEKEIAEEQSRIEEELLQQELEAAEAAALEAQLEVEKEEFLEDLSVLDGRILPELKVPNWRE